MHNVRKTTQSYLILRCNLSFTSVFCTGWFFSLSSFFIISSTSSLFFFVLLCCWELHRSDVHPYHRTAWRNYLRRKKTCFSCWGAGCCSTLQLIYCNTIHVPLKTHSNIFCSMFVELYDCCHHSFKNVLIAYSSLKQVHAFQQTLLHHCSHTSLKDYFLVL